MPASSWIDIEKNPAHVAREKRKAQELKKNGWWKNRIANGLCHYCGKKFPVSALTLDHLVPLARGGKSTRSNVVPACKFCNASKKILTPAEMILDGMKK